MILVIVLLFLGACSTDETNGTTYGFEQNQVRDEEYEWLQPNSYQITVDDSFELVSKNVMDTPENQMFFWHESSANQYTFTLKTTTEQLQKEVPTIDIQPINKYKYVYLQEYYDFGLTEKEAQDALEAVKKEVEEDSAAYLEQMKEQSLERLSDVANVLTTEDYDIKPFTYMIKTESELGVIHYELLGEVGENYVRARLSIPSEQDETLFEKMLTSMKTITFNKDEFDANPILDQPTNLSYEPKENLKGDYPEVGYSFDLPEVATFRYSFPSLHTYRYTFDTKYEESVEKEHFGLRSSELVVKVEKQENARNREGEIRNRALDDFVAYQHDYARTIDYLHENEDFNTGVFTTAVRVEFDGYEEYWFLKEVDGHVYEVFFDIAFEAHEYEELLESYLGVVRTFELKNVKE
ncbi:hypothetical protein [Alkalibacillus haloalkaliphilus]|uniref:hypothetical protein n=1 Tax=Alkalibacillus haloalkaliphilus TaxID=94136 RepID=UPI0003031853|nr:hypothetical protein [Alkalibacillus haloalkaliphilus]